MQGRIRSNWVMKVGIPRLRQWLRTSLVLVLFLYLSIHLVAAKEDTVKEIEKTLQLELELKSYHL